MVTSDRISAFDVVLDQPIPYKGRVLTELTAFWLNQMDDVVPNHLLSVDGASMLVRKAEMLPIECIVRGFLSGSAWKEYSEHGTVHGMPLPAGPAPVRAAARPHLHPLDQGRRRRPRREHLLRPGRRAGRARRRRRGRRHQHHRVPAGRGPGRGRRHPAGRHQVRAGMDRRPPRPVRRGPHARLVPVLGGHGLGAGHHAPVVRQAAGARLAGADRLGQAPAAARSAGRRGRGDVGTATCRRTNG